MSEYKVVVMGDSGVGKSAIVEFQLKFLFSKTVRFVQDVFINTYDPTIEDSYRKQVTFDEEKYYMLEILDTAGTEQFTAIRELYMKKGEGFVIVYSITSKTSFDQVGLFIENIYRIQGSNTVPVIIVGNKSDLEEEREVSKEEAILAAKKFGCDYIESSALKSENIKELFKILLERMEGSRLKKIEKKKKEGKRDELLYPMTIFFSMCVLSRE